MANSFFDFDTCLKEGLDLQNGENILPDDEECMENEEEYDALNDETFGTVDVSNLDDWEEQHEQFAEINESSKHSEQIESSISQLVLDSSDEDVKTELLTFPKNSSVWAYTPTGKNGDIFNSSSVLSSLQKASKTFIETHTDNSSLTAQLNNGASLSFSAQPRKICTVEELEKNLLKNSQNGARAQIQAMQPQQQDQASTVSLRQSRPLLPLPPPGHLPHPFHPILQHNSRLPPPGLPPLNIPPPGLRHLPKQLNAQHSHPLLPPGFRMLPPHPHLLPTPNGGVSMPPGFIYSVPVNHPFNFPPPARNVVAVPITQNKNNQPRLSQPNNPQHQPYCSPQIQQQQHQRVRHDSGNYRNHHRRDGEDGRRDEYAGLMTARDKQWLLNIQLLQLNTGTPYFDDYYYTIYKERKLKNNKENMGGNFNDKNARYQSGRQRKNSERQDNNTLTPRVYTPLQFENSLGKLQCGSVTAPRKIIDMDVVTHDKDLDSPAPAKDTRKTKQLLLELEALYSLLLKAEDIQNPLFVSNMEKLRELKQKQRLRELEQAPTPEQKQEVLRLFKLESEPIVENHNDYIVKIVSGLLKDEKLSSFLIIRKGKMLLLRLLPHLTMELFASQLLEIWSKVLLSLPITGRRDTAGDNILPRFYPHLKRYVQNCPMSAISDMVSGLVEVVRQETSRSTPLSHVGKSPLYFVVLNKFGVSALVLLFIRAEYFFSAEKPTERQERDWVHFLMSWANQVESVSKVADPLEAIPSQTFTEHVSRFPHFNSDKRALLEKHFVDVQAIN